MAAWTGIISGNSRFNRMPLATRRNPFSLAFSYLSTKASRLSSSSSRPRHSPIQVPTANPRRLSNMAQENKGAFISEARKNPMVVTSSPIPTAGNGEIIVKVAATAINPMDRFIQLMGEKLFNFLQYPYVGGSDVAGKVTEVGPGVTNFKVGDRVVGLCSGFDQRAGGFQHYVALHTTLVAPIPDDLSYADAAVMPLGLSTAACGLYQTDFLNLDPPSLNPTPKGKTLLVWAGASSVGSNAIQLAVASGYEVFTTSSPKNFGFCQSLGAAKVFDYGSPTVVQDLIAAFRGKTCAGGFAIQPGSEHAVFEVVGKSEGAKFVAAAMQVPNVPAGIKAQMVFGGTLKDNHVGPMIWGDFLPKALRAKKFVAAPPPLVVGHGLEHVQTAVDKFENPGEISAKKMVITLDS
ncbi:GroES-like protein [Hypoxylon sp. FL1284]|nr:GroES-like protein [Hypoxylon sp. FL1284]